MPEKKNLREDFALRLDQAYSLLNPVGRELTTEDVERAKAALRLLIEEAYEVMPHYVLPA